jgi:hypothetical protein
MECSKEELGHLGRKITIINFIEGVTEFESD